MVPIEAPLTESATVTNYGAKNVSGDVCFPDIGYTSLGIEFQ